MRAAVTSRYGPPDVVHLEDVEMPAARPDAVLVRVHASTVNRTDCGFRAAKHLRELIATGQFRPVIDRTYPLDEIVDAYRYVETGQKVGNVVIRN